MLTLHRRPWEHLVILLPDGRKIKIATSKPTRLCVDAPRDISVVRGELLEKETDK